MKREGIKQAEECMLAKGYRVTPMTKEQAAIYQGLDTDRRIQASAILASGGDIEAFKNAQ